jgi:hypothetical protein
MATWTPPLFGSGTLCSAAFTQLFERKRTRLRDTSPLSEVLTSRSLDTQGDAFTTFALDEGVLSSSLAEIFVASFCEVEDLKSLWMEYADADEGSLFLLIYATFALRLRLAVA